MTIEQRDKLKLFGDLCSVLRDAWEHIDPAVVDHLSDRRDGLMVDLIQDGVITREEGLRWSRR